MRRRRRIPLYGARGKQIYFGRSDSRSRHRRRLRILCDGQLRDFVELNSYDFATYCKGETVRAGGNEIQPFLTNVPVNVDGVTVIPGDFVFAQGTSAVIIPKDSVEMILKKARKIMNKLDQAKAGFINEDPQKIVSQGSSEL